MSDQPDPVTPFSDTASAAIDTERLILRPRVADDADTLFAAMSDPELMRWWSRAPFESVAELRAYFGQDSGGWRAWAITRKGDDRAIGFVAAGEKRQGVTEIGYLLAREALGQGLAREAVTGLIGLLFERGQRRLFADTDPENLQSIALLKRIGFRQEGHLRHEWQTHIGIRDSLIFGLLADEWKPTQG